MGARLSLLAPSAPTVAISSYIDILNNIQYIELINNSRFLKTIKAIDNSTGNLIVIKILIKPSNNTSNYNIRLQEITELIAKESSLLSQFNNILPWHKIIETDRAGYLIRQYIKTNLYDRLSLRPFLEPIEKLFLVYQMLKIIDDLHNNSHIHHGDLKLENFLVTSWNWLMLTDFGNYTKPTYIPEDNPSQFSFYFDNSGRRLCYIAPERFYNSKESTNHVQNINDEGKFSGKDALTNAMDMFSLGCVIAELYSDGEPTFTLSQLFKYMKNEYSPDLSSINDIYIRDLIQRLIQFNPEDRPSIETVINDYKNKCFPEFFYDFLYDFMSELNNNDLFVVPDGNDNISTSDLKIDKIYNNFDKISKALKFEYEYEDGSEESIGKFVPLKLNLSGMPYNYTIKSSSSFSINNKSKKSSLIILNFIFSLMKTLKHPSSKIRACELIIAFSERINDECKLDRSLPYLCTLLDEYIESSSTIYHPNLIRQNLSENFTFSSRVACFALAAITTLLSSCSYITPINVLMFPEYLLPKLSSLVSLHPEDGEKSLIKITLAGCLPYLANVSKKFWMMSKTFKSDALKSYNNKIMAYSLNNTNEGLVNSYNTFSIPKEQLDSDFENLALILLTDSNPSVKISLVNNVLPLCQFFGVDKTNDIILPHLITYLNDPNYELRLAFLSSILEVGPYVGVLSFEQYLLPLLIQTLGDSEQFVVLKVLEIFCQFVKDKLINPKTEFNALEIYKEILTNSINLVLHPSEWIRQSVLCLILAISDNLSDADRYCFLYPLIKGFLSYDLTTISWNTLYPCLTKPLSRQVYDLAVTWSLNATSKSLFWQQKSYSTLNDLKGASKRRIISFSKNMGKSVYLPKLNNEINFSSSTGNTSTVPLSPEDKQWFLKLKSVGLEDKGLWKIFILRDYIIHVSRSNNNIFDIGEKDFNSISNNINITPRNIFFEICYKSEPITTSIRTTETDVEASIPSESISLRGYESRRGSNSLFLPNFSKVKASLQTVQANVFGELELSHESNISNSNRHHHHIHSTKDSNSSHKVFSVNNSKIITANIKHSYTGYNPYMLNYLSNIDFDPTLDNFPEFGQLVNTSKSSSKSVWKPKGVCVAHINSNIVPGEIDSINCVSVCPSSEFFVTGSESGYLKVWDIFKLEKNINVKNSSLSINLKSSITSIKFIPNRFIVSVTTINGLVALFRIDVSRGKNKRIIKYSKLSLIRNHQLNVEEDGYVINTEFIITSKRAWLVGTTSTSKIIVLDIIKMEKEFELQNPLIHGIPVSFIIDHKQIWLLLGTNKGILCLWDLRFKMLLKSWKLNYNHQMFEIKKLVLLSSNFKLDINNNNKDITYFAMIGGNSEPDISIWEVPSFECKQILSSYTINPKINEYSLTEISNKVNSFSMEDILSALSITIENEANGSGQSMISLKYYTNDIDNYFISATWDKRIIVWDLNKVENSISLNNNYETDFTKSKINHSLTLVRENFQKKKKIIPDQNFMKFNDIAIQQFDAIKKHQDLITDIEIITKPFEMILSVDRNGFINLYK